MSRLHIDGHVTWDGKRVRLSRARYLVVVALSRRPGEIVSFEGLREAVWGEGAAGGASDETFRGTLRNLVYQTKLQFLRLDPMFDKIEAIHGVGYRWRTSQSEAAKVAA